MAGTSPLKWRAKLDTDALRIGQLWDPATGAWSATLTSRDRRRIQHMVSPRWLRLLRAGPTRFRPTDWILTPRRLTEAAWEMHEADGTAHLEHGVLYYLLARVPNAHSNYEQFGYEQFIAVEYLLGCVQKWTANRIICAPVPQSAERATVEPFRTCCTETTADLEMIYGDPDDRVLLDQQHTVPPCCGIAGLPTSTEHHVRLCPHCMGQHFLSPAHSDPSQTCTYEQLHDTEADATADSILGDHTYVGVPTLTSHDHALDRARLACDNPLHNAYLVGEQAKLPGGVPNPSGSNRTVCWPAQIVLTGTTATTWSASRGRLRWAHHRHLHVVDASLADIRAHWTHARLPGGGPRPTINLQRLRSDLDPHPALTTATAVQQIKRCDWLTPVKNFALECVLGLLSDGYACSHGQHGRCPLCDNEDFSVPHEIATCSATRAVRGWLLEVARQLVPTLISVSIASFVLYGLHPRIRNDPVALSLRECIFAQWRAIRSRKLHGHPAWSGSQIRSALNQRLERAIIYDYIHNPWVDICAKWRPYVTIGDDTPTINGLPTPSRGGGK
jgi:hypothetical protein